MQPGISMRGSRGQLYNQASKVVLVRDGDRTVITMANDFQGDVTEFAMVIPVPTFIEREQIHVTDNAIIEHLDAFTAPRLVEYFDENPCAVRGDELEALGYLRDAEAAAPLREDGALRAWRQLGDDERLVCWLKIMDGLRFLDIAELMGSSKSAVHRTYRRGLARMRKEVSRC